MSFLYATYNHDLFYIAVKYHDYIPKGIQIIEGTGNCIWNDQGEITQKVWQQELPFLYATHPHDLFYITIQHHQNIPEDFQVMEQTWNCIWNHQGGNNSESMKVRVVILVCNTSSWPVLHNCEVSWLYSKWFSSYGANTNLHLKPSGGNNSESMKARVVILVRDKSSWLVLHNYEVSWLYSIGYSSYRADKICIKSIKNHQGEMSAWKRELSFLYMTWHVLYNWSIMIIFQTFFKLWSGHKIASKTIKGK